MADKPEIVKILMEEERRDALILNDDSSEFKETSNVFNKKYSEEFYKNIFNQSSDGIALLDLRGNIIDVNKRLIKIFGYSKKEFTKLSILDIHPKYALDEAKQFLVKLLETGFIEFELDYINKKNEVFPGEITANVTPIGDNNYVQVIFRDVRKRKKTEITLRRSEKKYQDMINLFPDGVLIVNRVGVVTDCNPAFLKITGYSRNEIVGKNAIRMPTIPLKSKVKMSGLLKSILKGNNLDSINFDWKHKDGSIYKGNAKISLLKHDEKINGFQVVLRDTTDDVKKTAKLMEVEERYRSLFDGSMDLVFINDFKGNFIDANKACFDLLGYTQDEIMNLNYQTFLDKGQLLRALKTAREIKKYGFQKMPEIYKLKHKDGRIIDVETSSSLLYKNGKPYAIQGIARDITERKKTMEEMEKLVSIIKHSSELVNLATLDGKMIFLNEAGGKMLGISPGNVQDYNIMQVIPEHFIGLVENELLPKLLNGGSWKGDLQYKNLISGELVDVHAITFAIYEPGTKKPLYFANVSSDIRYRKKSEMELEKARKDLEKMNAKLEIKVEERTKEVNLLLRQKDEFINQLSHDLKNPLNPLINLLPMLEEDEKNKEKKEILEVIIRNVGYMKELVIKTVELAQLNSPNTEFNFEDTNLLFEMNAVIDTNKMMFEKNKIKVINKVPEDIEVSVDKLRFEELLNNLFNNSVKYTVDSGVITINACLEGDFVTISISDTGIGMNEEQLSHVFNEFYKADSSRHDFDSSGLGMPICKRIVEIHGGRIWAESEGEEKGSTIYFTLPRIIPEKEDEFKIGFKSIGTVLQNR